MFTRNLLGAFLMRLAKSESESGWILTISKEGGAPGKDKRL